MSKLNLNSFFSHSSILFLLAFQCQLFSQDVLDSVLVSGEKYKSFDEQIREEARKDIANGKVILFAHGWPGLNIDEAELSKLTHKYGFEYEKQGDVRSAIDRIYEEEVMIYLNKRNGDGWFDKFQEEAEKLIEYPTLPQKK